MIRLSVRPSPEVVAGREIDLELELRNTGDVACLNVVVELAVRRPLVLAHGDRMVALDRLGSGRHHLHPIRLRATGPGSGEIVLRTFSYRDTRGRILDASGTKLAVAVTPAPDLRISPEPAPAISVNPSAVDDLPSVFISHRSTDSPWFFRIVVANLRCNLGPHQVFVDTDLRGGQMWSDRLDTELRRCAVLVALIGPSWRSGSEILWREIHAALDRGIFLLPVLFDEAQMPDRNDLPAEINALADRHAVRVDPTHLQDDLMRIELEVRKALRFYSRG